MEVTDMPLACTLKKSEEVDSEENVRQRIFINIATPSNCCSVGKMHVGDSGVRNAARNDFGLSKFSVTNMDILCRNSAEYMYTYIPQNRWNHTYAATTLPPPSQCHQLHHLHRG